MKNGHNLRATWVLGRRVLVSVIVALIGGEVAEGQEPIGSYHFVATQTCINSSGHFDPATLIAPSLNFTQTEGTSGTAIFRADGTGSLTRAHSRAVILTFPQGIEDDFDCAFDWSSAPGGHVSVSRIM
jgi:hypothetical protein